MNSLAIAKLEDELRTLLGLTSEHDIRAVDAMVKELRHFRTLNPRAFHASVLMLASMSLATGEPDLGIMGDDVHATLERLAAIQKEVTLLLKQVQDQRVSQVLEQLGLSEADAPLPKEKVN